MTDNGYYDTYSGGEIPGNVLTGINGYRLRGSSSHENTFGKNLISSFETMII